MHEKLTLLGKSVQGSIEASQLEKFPTPNVDVITFITHEVTALCPVTNQPDLYTVEISYSPCESAVESKSLKMYLTKFRNDGIFGESLAATIADDFFAAIKPHAVTVKTTQQIRGGLQMTSVANRYTIHDED